MRRDELHVAVVFKDFSEWNQIDIDAESCVGLNVAGLSLVRALRGVKIDARVYPVKTNIDIVQVIDHYKIKNGISLTHLVIFAPWLSVWDVKHLIEFYPEIKFVVCSHANVGFLQADPSAVGLLRGYLDLTLTHTNFKLAGNSPRFVEWITSAYGQEVLLLPNLCPSVPEVKEIKVDVDTVRIGVFGAIRPEKNFVTATAAALTIHSKIKRPVELHMSSNYDSKEGRIEHIIGQMVKDVPFFKLVKHDWTSWSQFLSLVGSMELLIQPSYTESFNLVTAEGIMMDVPSVVSEAIYWAPDSWKADSDDAINIAEVGIRLMLSPREYRKGQKALKKHNSVGIRLWEKYLLGGHRSMIARWFD